MKFGQVENPEQIDFTLPPDHAQNKFALQRGKGSFEAFVGCAKWNKTDLKNFYPKGTKDELVYYASQFNSIELNATFYNPPTKAQVTTWKSKTPAHFRFYPKITQTISHFKRLKDTRLLVQEYCDAVSQFEEKLGMVFLQMHDNFQPKDFGVLEKFVAEFPASIPLAIEVRNAQWFANEDIANRYFALAEAHGITNVLVDTAGRRDMLHMRNTTPKTFIRYVGANHPTDYPRLDEWVERIKKWKSEGLETFNFFVHQNVELESPLLSAYFIEKLNSALGTSLPIPKTLAPASGGLML